MNVTRLANFLSILQDFGLLNDEAKIKLRTFENDNDDLMMYMHISYSPTYYRTVEIKRGKLEIYE